MFKPENVNEYWTVQPTNEINNNFFKYFFGIGNHHTSTRPVNHQRNPLISIGGNCSIPGLVITKPIPQKKGTDIAIIRSRRGINKIIYSLKKEAYKS